MLSEITEMIASKRDLDGSQEEKQLDFYVGYHKQ